MVHQIAAQDLNMRKVCTKVIPENFNDHKARQNNVSAEMLEQLETGPDFLNWVITGDEKCFFECDPGTKRE
jgi:hypothetical protein